VTVYENSGGDAIAVHLVNAAGTLEVEPGTLVGHSDPIPFPEHRGKEPVRIRVRKPRSVVVDRALYLDPEREEAVALDWEDRDAHVAVQIDPGLIRRYGLVEIGLGVAGERG